MMQQRPPRLAVALLHRFSADPALIGDVIEEYEQRRSRLWLWRQVMAAVAVNISGRARDTQPHRWKAINLTAAPRGSAVGGLGLLALAVLAAIVLPQAWWMLAIGATGGIGLGAMLVFLSRRRELRRHTGGRRNILLPVVLVLAAGAQSSQQPVAAVRLDPIEGIADAFESHQTVMLPGGHGSKPFHDRHLPMSHGRPGGRRPALLAPQHEERIWARSQPCRQQRGGDYRHEQGRRRSDENERIRGSRSKEERLDQTADGQSQRHAEDHAQHAHRETMPQHEAAHIRRSGAECYADADLTPPLPYQERQHAVCADD